MFADVKSRIFDFYDLVVKDGRVLEAILNTSAVFRALFSSADSRSDESSQEMSGIFSLVHKISRKISCGRP